MPAGVVSQDVVPGLSVMVQWGHKEGEALSTSQAQAVGQRW